MAIKPNNAYPNLTTDYLADYTLGFTFAPLLMKISLNTDLTIRPDQLFWHRDLGLLTKAFSDLGHDAYLVVHLATEPGATPRVPIKLDHPREQPCEAQQGLPRLRVAGPHSEIRTYLFTTTF